MAMFEPLPALIRLQREQLGLSLDALSALSGVSRSRIAALEKGDDNVTLDLLVKLANALRIKVIPIGGLRVEPAAPDVQTAAAAAEAIRVTGQIIDHAAESRAELERVSGPVSRLLANVLAPADQQGGSPENLGTPAGLGALARAIAERKKVRRRG
jgi:transcriptional regulator with XRE-family HTH domain